MRAQIVLFFLTQVFAGKNKNGKGGGAKVGAPFAEEFEAAHFREHHVENYELWQRSSDLRASLRAIGGSGYGITLSTEHFGDEFPRRRIVLDYEDTLSGFCTGSRAGVACNGVKQSEFVNRLY